MSGKAMGAIEILRIAEIKIEASFPIAQFQLKDTASQICLQKVAVF